MTNAQKILYLFATITICLTFCSCKNNDTPIDLLHVKSDKIIDSSKSNLNVANTCLKVQLNEYLKAFYGGDTKLAMNFLYPDIFNYLQITNPEEKLTKEIIAKSIIEEPTKKLRIELNQRKIKMAFEINKPVLKYLNDSIIIYKNIISVKIIKGLNSYSLGQEIISVSKDNGKNWKFMAYDKELTPKILRLNFDENTVNTIIAE